MKRKTILTGATALLAASLLAGCLLAGCETDRVTESEEGSAASAAVSSVSSEETVVEATSPEVSSEVSSEETSSGETSSEETPEPFEPTPLPEDLPGVDSPAPPETLRYYLPSVGHWENSGIDSPPLTITFTYGKNTMVVEATGDYGYYTRTDYRFDDRGHVVEQSGDYYDGSSYSHLYTYDQAGRVTSWTNIRRTFDEQTSERRDYTYGEDGKLIREGCTLTNTAGETSYSACEFTRTYDENGALTQLTERLDNGPTVEHLYRDGLERVTRYCDEDGTLSSAYSYDYNENGQLVRERYRGNTTDNASVKYSFYEGEHLIETRLETDGAEWITFRCAYDAYGRLLIELGNDWGNSYDVYSYNKNGSLCKVMGYMPVAGDRPGEKGGYEEMKHLEVTAWGNEAVTEMQLGFYRVAMTEIFGGLSALEDQFYTVKFPEP